MRGLIFKLRTYYSNFFSKIVDQCRKTKLKKAALAITLGICIGIIPFVGFTFFIVLAVAVTFRLNVLIAQAAHIVVSPLQFVFLLPFMKMGQHLFGGNTDLLTNMSQSLHSNLFGSIKEFAGIIISGVAAWSIIMSFTGSILYLIILQLLKRRNLFATN